MEYCPSFILTPQDKEQMTTGIYTTKWFLQCFIDRVSVFDFPNFPSLPSRTRTSALKLINP